MVLGIYKHIGFSKFERQILFKFNKPSNGDNLILEYKGKHLKDIPIIIQSGKLK